MTPIRVVLVDDHLIVREGLRAALQRADDVAVVGEAADADTATRVVAETTPDVVILDLHVPGASGPVLCRRVAEAAPASAVLVLTAFLNPTLLQACMTGGVRGYLLKDAASLDLVTSVREVAAGKMVFDPSAAGLVASILGATEPSEHITLRELEVLELLAKGLTNKEIGDRLCLSVNTVKGYLKEVMTKLGARNRVEAVTEAQARNLV